MNNADNISYFKKRCSFVLYIFKAMGKKTDIFKGGKSKKIIVYTLAILILISCYMIWRIAFSSNIHLRNNQTEAFLYVPTGADEQTVEKLLLSQTDIDDEMFFKMMLRLKCKMSRVYPGKYKLTDGMSNKAIIQLLRPANRLQVKLTLKFFRKKEDLVDYVSQNLEVNHSQFLAILQSDDSLKEYGFNTYDVIGMFTPNTYFFNWNTSVEQFMERMYKEYLKFWTAERIAKAKVQGLTPSQATTLASIVDRETNYNPEKSTIAGVYLNRLRDSMPLQADPTIVYAVGDFTIKRVRKGHLLVKSPYNTYMNIGLPPGPICTPSISSVDAVLNAEHHKYMFFCAKEDFSGRHNFAVTFDEHLQNARKFQEAMNEHAIE